MVTALILQMAQCIVVNPVSEDALQKANAVAENGKEMSKAARQVSIHFMHVRNVHICVCMHVPMHVNELLVTSVFLHAFCCTHVFE